MTELAHVWICTALTELIRADRIVSLYVSDGLAKGDRPDPGSSGDFVLYARLTDGREPVRIGAFGEPTRPGEILAGLTELLADVVRHRADPVVYIDLDNPPPDEQRPARWQADKLMPPGWV
ncbi:hypothetical protein Misp01_13530 [Microtetraspora sp. NBRC 13810]|uniref:hypothetical protein n=1 Tax=Microtetraspora sp. NBRC 13810 TaxID=3030990 RepID=UPI0024A13FFB|nr:hypothetical protein [Microtetraspora sp. NBRC 13810]GLW06223.1 hypothetical protein Misp01_13530 [Microtetraspora sp. NBRC 13810]